MSSGQDGSLALRLAASVSGLFAGVGVCILTFWAWILLSAASGRQQDLPSVPFVTGGLQVFGALLTPFFPRLGGWLMLLAAASTLALTSDIGVESSFLNGNIFGALTMIGLLVGPGILALLSSMRSNRSRPGARGPSASHHGSIY